MPTLGKSCSKESKEKNRIAHLGKKNHFFGKHHSLESIEKMRKAHSGKNNYWFGKKGYWSDKNGEGTPRWIDGNHHKRSDATRRGLGFIPMNELNEIADTAHHIDKELVMFVPSKLHESFRHSVKTGRRIDEMNNLAWKWYDSEGFKSYFVEPQITLQSFSREL